MLATPAREVANPDFALLQCFSRALGWLRHEFVTDVTDAWERGHRAAARCSWSDGVERLR